jgi:hypothetical protein
MKGNKPGSSFLKEVVTANVATSFFSIRGKTISVAPLTEKSDQYKLKKESASPSGLSFEAEE